MTPSRILRADADYVAVECAGPCRTELPPREAGAFGQSQVSPALIDGSQTGATSISLTGATWTSGNATLSFSSGPTPPAVGSVVVVSGISPSAYDGDFTVTGNSSTSVTYALPGSSPGSGSGGWICTATAVRGCTSNRMASRHPLCSLRLTRVSIFAAFQAGSASRPSSGIKVSMSSADDIDLLLSSRHRLQRRTTG
ncbi:MAG TPA: hypothetical protein VG815_19900 [Chloroflexota bacterium]|nr:hypothetical protein [Chloroflexota bacterium]